MNNTPPPSIKSLLLACVTSLVLAAVVLLVAVLPAEFNIDPTGLGKTMGLTVLSQNADTSMKAVAVSCSEDEKSLVTEQQAGQWKDSVVITVPPKKGVEYKFYIAKGEEFEFVWNSNGESLYFDFHGEPEGAKNGYFKSFKESVKNQSSGTLSVPFTGSHGWYWENKTNKKITINLKTRGNYKKIGLL